MAAVPALNSVFIVFKGTLMLPPDLRLILFFAHWKYFKLTADPEHHPCFHGFDCNYIREDDTWTAAEVNLTVTRCMMFLQDVLQATDSSKRGLLNMTQRSIWTTNLRTDENH